MVEARGMVVEVMVDSRISSGSLGLSTWAKVEGRMWVFSKHRSMGICSIGDLHQWC